MGVIWNTLKSVGNGIKDTVVGIGETVYNANQYTAKSVATLITDPKKFADDVANNVKGWGQNIKDSWDHGLSEVGDGIDHIRDGAGFYGLQKIVSGSIEAATGGGLGATDAYRDYVNDRVDFVQDELGNVSAVQHDGLTWFERVTTGGGSRDMAHNTNVDNEIREALAEGDTKKANGIYAQETLRQGLRTVKVAGTAVAVLAAPLTGGGSLAPVAAVAAAGTTASIVAGMGEGTQLSAFDKANLKDDIADKVSSEVAMLQQNGALSDENVDSYSELLEQYLMVNSYKGTNTSDRETFNFLVDANHLLNETPEITSLRQAYDTRLGEEVQGGYLTQGQVNDISEAGFAYDVYDDVMSDRDYVKIVAMTELQDLDCSKSQLEAYCGHYADYATGRMDDVGFMQAVLTDRELQPFVSDDGMKFEIPMKDMSYEQEHLLSAVSSDEHDADYDARTEGAVKFKDLDPRNDEYKEQQNNGITEAELC